MSWVIGVCCSTVGSIILNIGHNIMRTAHIATHTPTPTPTPPRCASSKLPNYLASKTWWAGFSLFLLGNGLDFVALSFAPQSLIAALGGVSLVSNTLLAPYVNGESLRAIDGMGTGLIVAGAVLAVVFGSKDDQEYDAAAIVALFDSPLLWIYWSCVALMVVVLAGCAWWVRSSLAFAAARSAASTAGSNAAGKWMVRYVPLLHIGIGGLVGGQTAIGAKASSELLSASVIRGQNQLGSGWVYLIVAVTAITALTQVHQFQLALEIADALLVVPNYYVAWTVVTLVSAGVFYREFDGMTVLSLSLFLLGILIGFVGVYLLSSRLRTTHSDDSVPSTSVSVSTVTSTFTSTSTPDHSVGDDDLDSPDLSSDPYAGIPTFVSSHISSSSTSDYSSTT